MEKFENIKQEKKEDTNHKDLIIEELSTLRSIEDIFLRYRAFTGMLKGDPRMTSLPAQLTLDETQDLFFSKEEIESYRSGQMAKENAKKSETIDWVMDQIEADFFSDQFLSQLPEGYHRLKKMEEFTQPEGISESKIKAVYRHGFREDVLRGDIRAVFSDTLNDELGEYVGVLNLPDNIDADNCKINYEGRYVILTPFKERAGVLEYGHFIKIPLRQITETEQAEMQS